MAIIELPRSPEVGHPLVGMCNTRRGNVIVKILSVNYSLFIVLICLVGCGPVMEATRPDPVDISQFVIGESRINVLAEIGSPTATTKDGQNSCDIYRLYTTGPGAVGKGAIAAGEAVADVFTLGLAEVVFTPAEGATRNSKHTIIFCYSPDNKLASLNQSDTAGGE